MSTPLRTYFNGPNGPVCMIDHRNNQKRYFHYDHQGTVQCLTDEAGAVTDRFASDAWGVQVKRTGSSINRQWYIGASGYYRQVDQALDYVRQRWLEPAAGRWLSAEPFRLHPLWAYAANSPAILVDPSGLQWQRGTFQYVPPLTDPRQTFNTRPPTAAARAKCPFVGTGLLAYFCGSQVLNCPTLYSFIRHWYSKSGTTVSLSSSIMYKLLTQGTHDIACNRFAKEAAAFAESILPNCPPAAKGPAIVALHPIWHKGARRAAASSADRDLWNAIGNSQAWAKALVRCECNPGGDDRFYMMLTYMLTDQFIGSDPGKIFAYECHLMGFMHDFIIEGKWEPPTFTWRRGHFADDVPKPCP